MKYIFSDLFRLAFKMLLPFSFRYFIITHIYIIVFTSFAVTKRCSHSTLMSHVEGASRWVVAASVCYYKVGRYIIKFRRCFAIKGGAQMLEKIFRVRGVAKEEMQRWMHSRVYGFRIYLALLRELWRLSSMNRDQVCTELHDCRYGMNYTTVGAYWTTQL
jgi:hypothetical protein